ncbi:MAG: transporter substrate-binding domain-containing protein [Chloroflexi bacterium]|nr:transporter substrate-binding domain-containing protein [Chloroflexota bacterium]
MHCTGEPASTRSWLSAALAAATIVAAACGGGAGPGASVATTAPAGAASAAPTETATGLLAQVKSRGVLRVANPQTSPPYSFRDEKNEVVGFDVDLANDLIKRLGIPRLEFIQGTFATFIPGLQSDKWDVVIAGQAITEERKLQVDFSLPYRVSTTTIFVPQGNTSIKSLDDLKGKRIAVPAGASDVKTAEAVPNAEVKTYENATLALTDVGLGRADAYLGSRFVGLYLAQKNGIKVQPAPTAIGLEENAISFKKGETSLQTAIDKAIRAMAADGTLTTISKRWFGQSEDMASEVKKLKVWQ